MSDWWNQPGGGAAEADGSVACPWCATRCAPDAETCGGCGAGLVGKDALDTLEIPGVTTVDPALQRLDAAGRKQPPSILGAISRMGTTGMIVGAVSSMASARTSKLERQAVDLNGPNPVIAALAEQMRARGPIEAGAVDPADAETGAPAAPESDPWRDLPRQTEDQDR